VKDQVKEVMKMVVKKKKMKIKLHVVELFIDNILKRKYLDIHYGLMGIIGNKHYGNVPLNNYIPFLMINHGMI
jgi:hypothetical protein